MSSFRQRVFGRPFLQAAFLPLFLLGALQGQDSRSLTGVWKIKLELDGQSREEVVYLLQKGDKISLRYSPKGKVYRGTVKDGKVTVRIQEDDGRAITLKGSLQEKGLHGDYIVTDGPKGKWSGLQLASIWRCDHTNPVHTAISEKQMRELTRKYQCRGWHRIGSADALKLVYGQAEKGKSNKE